MSTNQAGRGRQAQIQVRSTIHYMTLMLTLSQPLQARGRFVDEGAYEVDNNGQYKPITPKKDDNASRSVPNPSKAFVLHPNGQNASKQRPQAQSVQRHATNPQAVPSGNNTQTRMGNPVTGQQASLKPTWGTTSNNTQKPFVPTNNVNLQMAMVGGNGKGVPQSTTVGPSVKAKAGNGADIHDLVAGPNVSRVGSSVLYRGSRVYADISRRLRVASKASKPLAKHLLTK
jgi:hypothetical protein